jgi:hypothetical protein
MSNMKRSFGNWLAEEWTALVAVVISIFSLSVSVSECENTRLHDQPRMAYTYFYDDTGAGWKITNSGLGPARLRGFKLLVDGQPQNGFVELCNSLGLQPIFQFTNPRVGDLWASGHENTLFWVKPGPSADLLKKTWTRVTIEACYCSIHDQCWLFNSSASPSPDGDPRDDHCKTFTDQPRSRWWNG